MIWRRRVLALLIALAVGTACQQQGTGSPPTTRENICGEPGVCEGS